MSNILFDIFVEGKLLPSRVFKDEIQFFCGFEPTLIQDSIFFQKLLCFLEKYQQKQIIAGELLGDKEFVLNVDELDYDYWINKVFTIDGLFYTEIGITSESTNWGMYLDNVDFEIGIVGFEDHEQEKLFLNTFGEDQDFFRSLDDYIKNMELMLKFSNEAKIKYNTIIKNHRYG